MMKIVQSASTGGKVVSRKLDPGVFVVEVPEANRRISFGQPPDVVKRLQQAGYQGVNGVTTFVLCDSKTQDDSISWVLVEFPLLYALYFVPVTVGGKTMPAFNAGHFPTVAGLPADVSKTFLMMKYGNYGMDDPEEIDGWDLPEATRDALRKEILGLAVGNAIKDSAEFMRPVHLDPTPRSEKEFSDLGNGILLGRLGFNRYRVVYKKDHLDIDVTLQPGEHFQSPIHYRHIKFPVINFGILHTGEYDGMDPFYSCAHTTIIHRYEPVMIDYPANMTDIVTHYGLSKQCVSQVLLTHNHDDHIGAMVELLRRPERTRIVTTRPVQESVVRKIAALADMPQAMVKGQFEWTILPFRKDSPYETETINLDGLVATGHLSCHSVPTTVFTLSANHDGHDYTYAHFLDMVAFRRMKTLVDTDWMPAAHLDYLDTLVRKRAYNLVKWDVGCTTDASLPFTVHGQWQDLKGAATEKQFRIFTHATKESLDPAFEEEGRFAAVGDVDVSFRQRDGTLVSLANHNNAVTAFFSRAFRASLEYLRCLLLPSVPPATRQFITHYAAAFANSPKRPDPNIGAMLFEQGQPCDTVFLIVRGMVERTRREDGETEVHSLGNAGGGEVLGDLAAIAGLPNLTNARIINRLAYVAIPRSLFLEAMSALGVKMEGVYGELLRNRLLLMRTSAFSRDLSTNVITRLAHHGRSREVESGTVLFKAGDPGGSLLLVSGDVELRSDAGAETLKGPVLVGEGEFFLPPDGNSRKRLATATVKRPSQVMTLPFESVSDSPAAVSNIIRLIRNRRGTIYRDAPGVEPHFEM